MKKKKEVEKKIDTKKKIKNIDDVSNSIKKENLFLDNLWVWINVFAIVGIVIFYLTRLVYYYKIEHEPIKKKASLYETIITEKNITKYHDGLYKSDNYYYYKGMNVNNYLYYSDNMWRIIKIDNDNVQVILDDSITSLVFGKNGDFSTSDIKNWLNVSDIEHSGVFYNSLNSPDIYLNKSDWCYGETDKRSYTCSNKVNDYIGLLSIYEFDRAGSKKSYLNNGEYFWAINSKDNNPIYVLNTGDINNVASSGYNYYSYGIRPVINIKAKSVVFKGDGSVSNPYTIENRNIFKLSDISAGGFVSYNDILFRVTKKDTNFIHLVMNDNIKDISLNFNDSFNYLTNDFYNSFINKDDFVESVFYTGNYIDSYTNIYSNSYVGKVGLLNAGDFYINDSLVYYLINHHTDGDLTTYSVNGMARLFIDDSNALKGVRPVISVRGDLTIDGGDGTQKNPYKVVAK